MNNILKQGFNPIRILVVCSLCKEDKELINDLFLQISFTWVFFPVVQGEFMFFEFIGVSSLQLWRRSLS